MPKVTALDGSRPTPSRKWWLWDPSKPPFPEGIMTSVIFLAGNDGPEPAFVGWGTKAFLHSLKSKVGGEFAYKGWDRERTSKQREGLGTGGPPNVVELKLPSSHND